MSKPSQATLLVELVQESDVELLPRLSMRPPTSPPARRTARLGVALKADSPLARTPLYRATARRRSTGTAGADCSPWKASPFEGLLHDVELRLAQHEDAIYLDLADDHWNMVEITALAGRSWRRQRSRFRRRRGMQSCPPRSAGAESMTCASSSTSPTRTGRCSLGLAGGCAETAGAVLGVWPSTASRAARSPRPLAYSEN